MAMLAFSHFEKSKNQLQLIRHFILETTLVSRAKIHEHSATVVKA